MSATFARMLEQYGCNVDVRASSSRALPPSSPSLQRAPAPVRKAGTLLQRLSRGISSPSTPALSIPSLASQGIWRAVVDAGKQVGLTLPPLTEEVVVEDKTFAIVKKLGEGGFSYVHLAREIPDLASEDYALKRILIHEEEHQGAIQNEIDVMRALDHPNILPLLYAEIEPHRSPPPGARVFVRKRASLVFPAYLGAFSFTLVPIRPRWRGERRSLRTFAGVSLRPGSLAFNPRPRRLSTTKSDAFQLHPDVRSYGTALRRDDVRSRDDAAGSGRVHVDAADVDRGAAVRRAGVYAHAVPASRTDRAQGREAG
jgi:hypothetical protein